ncbi:hypothetical protein IVB41_05795 [Bradyrhizobium sp. 44]|uniref:hypothetical protein n=1 Tax=Bradyrhizobium sp. 44 TaxID=2782675 RepID=UPI001FFB53AD|nr:hypothetical protein [Bradyrhizobium sp. 44]MCK1283447.1 hypothetical protein [Bradyrhizobium sp. 44]
MTPQFIGARLDRMDVLYKQATPTRRTTWRVLTPGMYLAERVTAWPFDVSAKERLSLAAIFNTMLARRGELL